MLRVYFFNWSEQEIPEGLPSFAAQDTTPYIDVEYLYNGGGLLFNLSGDGSGELAMYDDERKCWVVYCPMVNGPDVPYSDAIASLFSFTDFQVVALPAT